jgi:phosphohistidine phosphatase
MKGTTMRLYVLRHGPAVAAQEWEGSEDARPLTEEGQGETRAAARGLALLRPDIEVIYTSPFARAFATAQIAGEALAVEVVPAAALAPGARLEQLRALLQERAEAPGVMVVGHEPDLSTLVGELIAAPQPARLALKKGGCACVDIPAKRLRASSGTRQLSGSGELRWLLTPPQLALMAPVRQAHAARKRAGAGENHTAT